MSTRSCSPNSKRVRLLSPLKVQQQPAYIDFPPLNGIEDLIDPDATFDEEMFAQLLDPDYLPGTPPPEANEVQNGLMHVDYKVESIKQQINLTDKLLQVTEQNNLLRRELEMFKEEVNKRVAKLEENSHTQINELSDIAGTEEEHESESQNESEIQKPDDETDDTATFPEPGNTVPESDNEDGLGPDSDTEAGETDDTATFPEPESGLPILGSLDEEFEAANTNIINTSDTQTRETRTKTTTTCYACKNPVHYNIRRRNIDNERRDMCAHCSAHIYKVLFPTVYKRTYWDNTPLPDIVVPSGIDLEVTMKEARGTTWQPKICAGNPGFNVKTVVGYDLTDNLLDIIMDTYRKFVRDHPIQPGKIWKYWKKVGFAALTKFDENFKPSEKHTSLGSNIHHIVQRQLDE